MVDDVEALSLVRECRELEERYKSNFTSDILSANGLADGLNIIRNAQKIINKKDQLLLLQKVSKLWGEISVKIMHTNVDSRNKYILGTHFFIWVPSSHLRTHFFYLGTQFSFWVHTLLFGYPVFILGTHFFIWV